MKDTQQSKLERLDSAAFQPLTDEESTMLTGGLMAGPTGSASGTLSILGPDADIDVDWK